MAPIVHTLTEVYKEAYRIGKKIPKRDRYGLYARIEDVLLDCMTLAIEAALLEPAEKVPVVKRLRVRIDISKRLVRLCREIGIIDEKKYFSLEEKLIEASKMAYGWLQYLYKKQGPLSGDP